MAMLSIGGVKRIWPPGQPRVILLVVIVTYFHIIHCNHERLQKRLHENQPSMLLLSPAPCKRRDNELIVFYYYYGWLIQEEGGNWHSNYSIVLCE